MAQDSVRFNGNLCIEVSPIPNVITIFGASGDLAHRKLIPAMFSLYRRKLFHQGSSIVGCARSPMTDEQFRDKIKEGLKSLFSLGAADPQLLAFLERIRYVAGDYADLETYRRLGTVIEETERSVSCEIGRVYYLSTPSTLYADIILRLGESGLVEENFEGRPWRNVVIEKPFGRDLESARTLDREIHQVLKERQIYRIDHYLGKETVQNILMFRFANLMFEPIWNQRYIQNVQITVAESIGVEHRAGYYDQSGLLRDMFQNHMLEMLSLVAMEPPPSFEANRVRDEKVKLLRSIRPFSPGRIDETIVRGQYGPGECDGIPVPGYMEEDGVTSDSCTETFAAARIHIDNWRWQGVPFFLRSGKRLKRRISEIAITFKRVPHSIFAPIRPDDLSPNMLVMNVQPEEGMALTIQAKQPGPKLCMGSLTLDFRYRDIFPANMPEAYERLILDSMLGDQTLFIRNDTIELAWTLLNPVLDAWREAGTKNLFRYPAGSWGPTESDSLTEAIGTSWRNP